MNTADQLVRQLTKSDVNSSFSEAVLTLVDGTRLCFRHTVDQRWARALGSEADDATPGLATELVEQISGFRLNAKHLDIQFADGSRFDRQLPRPG